MTEITLNGTVKVQPHAPFVLTLRKVHGTHTTGGQADPNSAAQTKFCKLDYRLPPRSRRELRSSRLCRSEYW